MSKNLGKWIEDNTIDGSKVRTNNEQSYRSRNAANTADLNLLKGNSVDKAEFGVEPVYSGVPTGNTSLVNKQWVEDVLAGIRDPKDAVRLATTAALAANTAAGSGAGKTLTADADGALSIDGQGTNAGDRVGVLFDGIDNGIYTVTDEGGPGSPWILTRATDADEDAEVTQGMSFDVVEGTINGKTRWLLTTDNITVDTTSLTFVEVPTAQTQVQFKEEKFTLVALDISNGYVDLANDAETQSLTVYPAGGPVQIPTDDYTLSTVSLVTRVTFAGDLSSELVATDVLIVRYAHF